jgi:acyl transferase domain-containing protein
LLALGCGAERAAELMAAIPGYLALAADNGPGACIVSGATDAVAALEARSGELGVSTDALAVSHAYHSQMIADARGPYRAALARVRFDRPSCEVVSTVDGLPLRAEGAREHVEHLASQFVEPVRLRDAVETLYARGVRVFVECGPKWPLTTFAGQILAGRAHVATASMHPKIGEVTQLVRALACLFVHHAAELSPVSSASAQHAPSAMREETKVSKRHDADKPARSAPSPEELVVFLKQMRGLLDAFLAEWEPLPISEGARAPEVSRPLEPPARPPIPAAAPTPELARAPEPPPAAFAPVDRTNEIATRLIERTAERTGYPAEMLGLDLDLEADLGIDTVKQVAIFGEVRASYGLAVDPSFRLRDVNTLRKVAIHFAERLARGDARPKATSAPLPRAEVVVKPEPAASRAPIPERAPPPPAHATDVIAHVDDVSALLVARMAERTGYPEEMLGLDLDLEADLGIDTVKQVAIAGEVRQRLGLAIDPSFRLREVNTLRKLAEHFAARLARDGAPAESPREALVPAPMAPPDAPAPRTEDGFERVAALLIAKTAARTGYPDELLGLDLDLEADLGIDTVKQIGILSEARAALGLAVDPSFKLREHPTLRKAAEYLARRLADNATQPGMPAVPAMRTAEAATPKRAVSEAEHAEVSAEEGAVGWVDELTGETFVTDARCLRLALEQAVARGRSLPMLLDLRVTGPAPRLVAPSTRLAVRVTEEDQGKLRCAVGAEHEMPYLEVVVPRAPMGEDFEVKDAEAMLRVAFERRDRSPNGEALRAALPNAGYGVGGAANALWAYAGELGEVVGAFEVPGLPGGDAAALAALVDGALALAAFGFYDLDGCARRLASVAEVRVHRMPASGETLWAHARTDALGDRDARGEVTVLDEARHVVARLSGIIATRVPASASNEGAAASARAWQRFHRRLGGPLLEGEDHGW